MHYKPHSQEKQYDMRFLLSIYHHMLSAFNDKSDRCRK